MRKSRILLSTFFCLLLGGVFLVFTNQTFAASLVSVSDTITTSRPSASAPLAGDQAANATQVTISDNGSIFLASDSATLLPDTGETLNTVTVASMSAANTPASNQRVVYFTTLPANTHHSGDPIIVPITAMHTVKFTNPNPIPSGGKILITFPGAGNNTASPSATTFAFNGLNSDTGTKIKVNGASCTISVAAPTITCTTTAAVSANTVITFLIGCTANSGASCTTQSPTLINPAKTAAAGTADTWFVTIKTQDGNSVDIDTARSKIATIESVQVQANVDPTLTFTIAGIANSAAINTGNTTGCTNTEVTNAGNNSTATTVNMGTLSSSQINIAAQLLTVSTNAINGYSLTATSSGHLINPATGFWIADSTTPTAMTQATPYFGVHPCGLNVNTTTWGSGATGGGAGAKYGWPTQTSSVTLASSSTGPIGNTASTGGVGAGLTSVEYGATVDLSVPAGIYTTVITYVATPTF